jgi:hypothetical protein
VTSGQTNHGGAVLTCPNVRKDHDDVPISSFRTITSRYAATSPHVGIYNVAYDIWLNGVATDGSTEVMIWTVHGLLHRGLLTPPRRGDAILPLSARPDRQRLGPLLAAPSPAEDPQHTVVGCRGEPAVEGGDGGRCLFRSQQGAAVRGIQVGDQDARTQEITSASRA